MNFRLAKRGKYECSKIAAGYKTKYNAEIFKKLNLKFKIKTKERKMKINFPFRLF